MGRWVADLDEVEHDMTLHERRRQLETAHQHRRGTARRAMAALVCLRGCVRRVIRACIRRGRCVVRFGRAVVCVRAGWDAFMVRGRTGHHADRRHALEGHGEQEHAYEKQAPE